MSDELKNFYRVEARDYHSVRYGSWYGQVFAGLHHDILRQVLDNLPREARILDVATGTGHSLDVLQYAGKDIYATDLTMEMLHACRERIDPRSGINYLASNALSLPFADSTFDLVNSSRFLHLLQKAEQRQVLAELGRVLRPGGVLVVDFYNQSHWILLGLPIAIYRGFKNKRPTGDTLNRPDEVSLWLKDSGFQVVRLNGIGSYGLTALRPLPVSMGIAVGKCFGSRALRSFAEQFIVIARKV